MQSCTNDMAIRNVSTIIWNFFTKLETDVSKAQYVVTECVFSLLCFYIQWCGSKKIAIGRTFTSGFGFVYGRK